MNRSKWLVVLGLVLVSGLVFAFVRGRASSQKSAAGAEGGRGGAGGPVPVVTAAATREDVPVYLEGLGTVQAFQSVTVRARVDGQLEKVGFREGQDVRAGDFIALIDPRPFQAALGQAVGKKGQDEAALLNGRRDLERYRILVEKNLLQRQQLDSQQATVSSLEAAVRGDQAAVDSAQVQLDYTRIKAPIPGRTGIRQVDPGNIVHANDTNGIVVITQVEPIVVIFTVPEQDVGAVNEEQNRKPLEVDAIAADGQTVLDHGQLLLIDNQIDTTTGTARLKAVFPNAGRRLWPGQFVNARMLLKVRAGGTVVPAPAIQRGPQGAFAYVVQADNTVAMRTVVVAQTRAGKALIDDGMKVGEKVVVEGQYKLQPGSKVLPQAPAGGDRRPGTAALGRETSLGSRP